MKEKNIITFKKILSIIEERSTCARVQVGALITKDDRVISTGWNGSPAGLEHCIDKFKEIKDEAFFMDIHKDFSERFESHGEQNAIAAAAKNGIALADSTIFTTVAPCTTCAKLIIGAGIKEVYYIREYDRSTYGLELLIKCGIRVQKI